MEQKQYLQGFNSGYLLTKFEPGLVTKMAKTMKPRGEYLEGFFSGKGEYELEYQQTQLQRLKKMRGRTIDKRRDREPE